MTMIISSNNNNSNNDNVGNNGGMIALWLATQVGLTRPESEPRYLQDSLLTLIFRGTDGII